MTKEQIYDEKLDPLMAQIIEICKDNKIAMIADFSIPSEDDDSLHCTSVLLSEEYNPSGGMLEAFLLLRPNGTHTPMMLTIQHADGSKTLTAALG
jgi:hypothetical protein